MFSFELVKFETSGRHPSGDVVQAVDRSLPFRRDVQVGGYNLGVIDILFLKLCELSDGVCVARVKQKQA